MGPPLEETILAHADSSPDVITGAEQLDPHAVRELVDGWPPLVWFKDGRLLRTSLPDVTRDAWCGLHGVLHTDRPDTLALLCEPFLDTEFTPEDALRSGKMLNTLGFSDTDVATLRDTLREPMLSHNALWWEWVHLGYSDVLSAWPGSQEAARTFCDGLVNRAWVAQGPVQGRRWTGSDPESELSEVYAAVTGARFDESWTTRRDAIRSEIEAAYSEPWRRFHTLRHLAEAWALGRASLPRLRGDDEARRQLAWTILYHDVVYRPGSRDNEELSARRCDERMVSAGESDAFREAVVGAISWSARHDRASANSPLLRAFFDADMGVLGLAPARYDEYAEAVQAEYAAGGVTREDYARGRLAFLSAVLSQVGDEPIYFGLDPIHDGLFRENLRRERVRIERTE